MTPSQGRVDRRKPNLFSCYCPVIHAREGRYWIWNSAVAGWQSEAEPCNVYVYGFNDCTPTVTLPSEERCSDLSAVDGDWAGPTELPGEGLIAVCLA